MLLGLLFLAVTAQAQGEEPYLARPPELVHFEPATLPAAVRFPTPEVFVVLALDVDETGAVTGAAVLESAGAAFDEAALAATKAFRFDPGVLSTGEAVPVEVTFRYRFEEPPPPPVRFGGRLMERGSRRPIPDVRVVARAGDAVVAEATTDDEGRFSLAVPVAQFVVLAVPGIHERLEAPVDMVPGEEREETFYLEADSGGVAIVVRADRVQREVTRRVIPQELVQAAPGTGGDTLKIVQSLPGVARTSFDDGSDLVLRGANPGDSKVFVEGVEVPLAYHFGGLRAIINNRFLDRLEFVPGNFAADYGRATGGVVDIRLRDPADDLFRGEIDINLYDAGFALEGPLGGGWSIGAAFHRSYIDAILPALLPDDATISFETAPQYYDYQLVTAYRPNDDHELRLLWYGSYDRMVLVQPDPDDDPAFRGKVDMTLMFHVVSAQYRAKVTPWLRQESSLSFGWLRWQGTFGPAMAFDQDWLPATLRTAWTADVSDWLTVRAGLDWILGYSKGSVAAIQPPKEGEQEVPLSVQARYATDLAAVVFSPGFFLETTFRPTPGVTLIPSLRVDRHDDIDAWSFDPRFVARWDVLPGATLKAGVGLFQMPPGGDESNEDFGTPDLLPERAVQASLGLEQQLGDAVTLEVTGFHKWLDRLVVGNPAAAYDPTAPAYTNDGSGRVLGVEVLLRGRFPGVFNGWIAYTYQRAWRRDQPADERRPMDYDQPHILTALGTFELGRGWTAGFRFRYVSGNPETPVHRALYDAGTGTWVPVYGATNSVRMPAFHQLDLRVDKTWLFETWKLNLYLEVQNVYNRGNPEAYSYSHDYRDRSTVTGLPILPIFGIRGEW